MWIDSLDATICRGQLFLSAVGITVAFLVLLKAISIMSDCVRFVVLRTVCRTDPRRFGKWAIVTGATDGIGKAYSRQLAKRGVSLILISRNVQKLFETAEEIRMEFDVRVRTIQADFTEGWELYSVIKAELPREEIGILVNNVGVLEPHPCYFLDLTEDEILNIINVNVSSMLLMTVIALPLMIERKIGIIVNVSSLLSEYVTPLMSCYGASKCMVTQASRSLYWETRKTGVYVQTLLTSCVTTKLIGYSNIFKYFWPLVTDPNSYSKSALRILGETSESTGYWGHSVQLVFSVVPTTLRKYTLFLFNSLSMKRRRSR